jgi:hypothetical protein
MKKLSLKSTFIALAIFTFSGVASAQATRTWVSGVGDDVNPCSRTAPCKTFAGAIGKTAAGGVINVLDSGSFGSVIITKSITIDSADTAGVAVSAGTNGIVINDASANAVVTLRGLSIDGITTGGVGIRVQSASSVLIEECNIDSFASGAISVVNAAGALTLELQNVRVRNSSGALRVAPTASGTVSLLVDDLQSVRSLSDAILLSGAVNGIIRDSRVVSVVGDAVRVGGGATVTLDNVTASDATGNGIFATGIGSIARLSRSVVTANAQGINTADSGQVLTYGDNRINGNAVNGSASAALAPQ